MAFNLNLDSIMDKVSDLAQTGVAKSKQLAEIAKLKTANMSEEDAIKKAYLEIGKLYYAERGLAPEGAYVALCEKITAAKCSIEENNARIADLKDKEDITEAELVHVEESAPAEDEESPVDEAEAPEEAAPAQPAPETQPEEDDTQA